MVAEPAMAAAGAVLAADMNFWVTTCFAEKIGQSLCCLLQWQQKHSTAQFSNGRSSTSENSPI
jgi:hypothetical protein